MPLTEIGIQAIKPSGKVERFHDSQGLYLELSKVGSKLWRWKYILAAKRNDWRLERGLKSV